MDGLSVQLMLRNGDGAEWLSRESAASCAEELLFAGTAGRLGGALISPMLIRRARTILRLMPSRRAVCT